MLVAKRMTLRSLTGVYFYQMLSDVEVMVTGPDTVRYGRKPQPHQIIAGKGFAGMVIKNKTFPKNFIQSYLSSV